MAGRAGLAALVVTGLLLGACGSEERPAPAADGGSADENRTPSQGCKLDESSKDRLAATVPGFDRRHSVVVACGKLPGGKEVELTVFSSGQTGQCVATAYRSGGGGVSCAADRGSHEIANVSAASDRPGRSPTELIGSTPPEVTDVIVRYVARGDLAGAEKAILAEVTGETQERVRAKQPYNVFLAEVPAHAGRVTAEARINGRPAGTTSFEGLMQPPPDSPEVAESAPN